MTEDVGERRYAKVKLDCFCAQQADEFFRESPCPCNHRASACRWWVLWLYEAEQKKKKAAQEKPDPDAEGYSAEDDTEEPV